MRQPKYVSLNGTILRFDSQYNEYWCDNGDWGVGYRQLKNVFYDPTDFSEVTMRSVSNISSMDNKSLKTVTEKAWIKAVGDYIPDGYVLEDGTEYHDKSRKENNPCGEIVLDTIWCGDEVVSTKTNYSYLLIAN